MKAIQPISVWFNGEQVQANSLNLYVVNDNLASSATFCYQLLNVTVDQEGTALSQQLSQGNLTMSGTDYQNWGNTGDINDEAYVWAAQQLNLTLV